MADLGKFTVEQVAALASAAIAGLGFFALVVQLQLAARREQFRNTLVIIDSLQGMLTFRYFVPDLTKKMKTPNFDFRTLSEEELAGLSKLSNLFGQAGLLARKKQIKRSFFIPGWARHIAINHKRLQPYMEWRRSLPGGVGLLDDFDWLAKKEREHIKRRSGEGALKQLGAES